MAPSRTIIGGLLVRSRMVEGRTPSLYPSVINRSTCGEKISFIFPGSRAASSSAPEIFALVETRGNRRRSKRAWTKGWEDTRTASVCPRAILDSGEVSGTGRIRVSGPGQKWLPKVATAGETGMAFSSRKGMSGIRTMKGWFSGRPLMADIFPAGCPGANGSHPMPYRVSVG